MQIFAVFVHASSSLGLRQTNGGKRIAAEYTEYTKAKKVYGKPSFFSMSWDHEPMEGLWRLQNTILRYERYASGP
jgi:hypothetical protein